MNNIETIGTIIFLTGLIAWIVAEIIVMKANKKVKLKNNREKIIQELEHKLSVVLDYATDGEISKPYTDIQHIQEAMNKKILREWERAIQDYRKAVSDAKYSDRPKALSEQETKST